MAWAEQRGNRSWRVRYVKDDGTLGSIPGFPTQSSAENYASTLEVDQQRGTFIDPAHGQITLAEWSTKWVDALDVGPRTDDQYRGLLRNHILPRWGQTALCDISNIAVATWGKNKRAAGYSPTSVTLMTKVLSMMLADAADERLIPANPIRPRRRGTRPRTKRPERLWATPEQALRIADQATALTGPWAGLLILTAAYTGARWGELTGLQRHNTLLHRGTITIDPEHGALQELNGHCQLGPPKTAESARTISLPPFLTTLLQNHLATHTYRHVFVTADGEHPRRSNFARRVMRPATDGNRHRNKPTVPTTPITPGLTFHGLRHSHKTWLIDAGIPEIAQARRLGHTLNDDIQELYSHVAANVEQRLLTALEDQWHHTLTTTPLHHLELPPAHDSVG